MNAAISVAHRSRTGAPTMKRVPRKSSPLKMSFISSFRRTHGRLESTARQRFPYLTGCATLSAESAISFPPMTCGSTTSSAPALRSFCSAPGLEARATM